MHTNKLMNGVQKENMKVNISELKMSAFDSQWLQTNTAQTSIDLKFVLDWGPGKDGIPAIFQPKFIKKTQIQSQVWLKDDTWGIVVSVKGDDRFYPYSVLYWHEIVNDTVWWQDLVVTFCPLCWSAIVYDSYIGDEKYEFWVSGKLYNSNLLMYDLKTESLWSQNLWEALIGDNIWKKLSLYESNIMQFSDYKKYFPEWLILSEDTGFIRAYDMSPYSWYETSDELYFPVDNEDIRLPKKELLYVLEYKWEKYAFVRKKILEWGKIDFSIWSDTMQIIYRDGKIISSVGEQIIPWYVEMWFSYISAFPDAENIWWIE